MRVLTGGSIAIMCPASRRRIMTAGPDGLRGPNPYVDGQAVVQFKALVGSLKDANSVTLPAPCSRQRVYFYPRGVTRPGLSWPL